jgi:CRISPR/Cas system-associated exonuclease Cas4 (RecB family)
MNIEHISISRKQCWDLCEQQYKYRYHLREPVEGEQPYYFTYGKIVHKIAEAYVLNKGRRSIHDIAAEVLSGRIQLEERLIAPQKIMPEYKIKFPRHVRTIEAFCNRIGMDGKVEYKFEYDLDPPHKRLVTGVIDRLIQRGDKFFIIDYKTSKKNQWRKDANSIRDDLQLRTYARVAQREFGAKAENIHCALYYLEGPEMVATKFNEESLINAESELLQTYLEIEQKDPSKAWGSVGRHCSRCDYQNKCPFYKEAEDYLV